MQYEDQGFVSADDGTKLFYGIRGKGPVVVLLDGIGCDGFAWTYLQPALAEHYRVIHPHYRGHGRSGLPGTGGMGIDALADDVIHLVGQLGVQEFAVVGHSMGTQVCLETYRRGQARVRGLALLCGSYGRITQTFHGTKVLEHILPTILKAVHENRSVARALWGRIPPKLAFRFARAVREIDALAIREEDFTNYWDHIGRMDPDVFLGMLDEAGKHTAEELLPNIASPTLVMAAERDTFTPPSLAKHMSETIPGADFMLLHGGSHAAPVEQPKRIIAKLEEFLSERVFPQAG